MARYEARNRDGGLLPVEGGAQVASDAGATRLGCTETPAVPREGGVAKKYDK